MAEPLQISQREAEDMLWRTGAGTGNRNPDVMQFTAPLPGGEGGAQAVFGRAEFTPWNDRVARYKEDRRVELIAPLAPSATAQAYVAAATGNAVQPIGVYDIPARDGVRAATLRLDPLVHAVKFPFSHAVEDRDPRLFDHLARVLPEVLVANHQMDVDDLVRSASQGGHYLRMPEDRGGARARQAVIEGVRQSRPKSAFRTRLAGVLGYPDGISQGYAERVTDVPSEKMGYVDKQLHAKHMMLLLPDGEQDVERAKQHLERTKLVTTEIWPGRGPLAEATGRVLSGANFNHAQATVFREGVRELAPSGIVHGDFDQDVDLYHQFWEEGMGLEWGRRAEAEIPTGSRIHPDALRERLEPHVAVAVKHAEQMHRDFWSPGDGRVFDREAVLDQTVDAAYRLDLVQRPARSIAVSGPAPARRPERATEVQAPLGGEGAPPTRSVPGKTPVQEPGSKPESRAELPPTGPGFTAATRMPPMREARSGGWAPSPSGLDASYGDIPQRGVERELRHGPF